MMGCFFVCLLLWENVVNQLGGSSVLFFVFWVCEIVTITMILGFNFRYVLAISILSMLYTGGQVFKQYQEMNKGKSYLEQKTSLLVDFVGDQVRFFSHTFFISFKLINRLSVYLVFSCASRLFLLF